MSRPTYETADHLASETDVAMHLQAAWAGCSLVKLPRRFVLDYAVYRDRRLTGFCEIKCRSHLRSTYPTLLVSAAKWREAVWWKTSAGLSTALAVRFIDGTVWRVRLGDVAPVFVLGGRLDRNDPEDQEPMLQINVLDLVPVP